MGGMVMAEERGIIDRLWPPVCLAAAIGIWWIDDLLLMHFISSITMLGAAAGWYVENYKG